MVLEKSKINLAAFNRQLARQSAWLAPPAPPQLEAAASPCADADKSQKLLSKKTTAKQKKLKITFSQIVPELTTSVEVQPQ